VPDEEDVSRIDRRVARSGNVSYSDPVMLHETSKSRGVLVPFFVPQRIPDHLLRQSVKPERIARQPIHQRVAFQWREHLPKGKRVFGRSSQLLGQQITKLKAT
jgi:hypothetical protein